MIEPTIDATTSPQRARAPRGARRLVDVLEERLALAARRVRRAPRRPPSASSRCAWRTCAASTRRSTWCRSPSARRRAASLLRDAARRAAARDRRPVLRRAGRRGPPSACARRSRGAWCTAATWSPTSRATRRRCARSTRLREDAGVGGDGRARGRGPVAQERSRDETSEVVRLVRSTLHDALKIGASDIHLESLAARPGDQVPHRRHPRRRSS